MLKRKMTREERIHEAIIEVASTIGLDKPENVRRQFQTILSKPSRHGPEKTLLLAVRYTICEYLRREARRYRTEKQLETFLQGIRARKHQLPTIIRKGMDEMRKTLPRLGGPGRGETLSQTQKIEACEQIATMLKTKATTLPDTFEAVAESFRGTGTKVSARTVKRVWENRASLYA